MDKKPSLAEYIKRVLPTALLVLVGGWGGWVLTVAWFMNREDYRIIICGVSLFWLGVGGLLWLQRKN